MSVGSPCGIGPAAELRSVGRTKFRSMHAQTSTAFRRFIRGWFYDWHLVLIINFNIRQKAFEDYATQYIQTQTPATAADEAENLRQNLYRIVWIRLVDHFQTYLAGVLFAILTRQPDLIRIAADAAKLKAKPKSAAKAARTIRGFTTYQAVFSAINAPLAMNSQQKQAIAHGIKFRNLIVHAEGVDERGEFVKMPDDAEDIDILPGIAFDQLFSLESAVRAVAEQAGATLVDKFQIGTSQNSPAPCNSP